MDRIEFNERIDRLKRRVEEEDYATALEIIKDIDWQRVRNTNLLTTAALVYEKNGMLQKAKDVMVIALERSPVGKHILYKLTELAVMSGDLEEAEDYYYEFNALAPKDISNYVLQYLLMKANHAPIDQQLEPLEKYCEIEPDEKWMYELASAYESAGMPGECVAACDKIALLFGDSPITNKALRMKQRYAELTDEQRKLLYPRSSAKVIKAEGGKERYTYGSAGIPEGYYKPEESDDEAELLKSEELAQNRFDNEDEGFYDYVREMERIMEEEEAMIAGSEDTDEKEPEAFSEEERPEVFVGTAESSTKEESNIIEDIEDYLNADGDQLSFSFDEAAELAGDAAKSEAAEVLNEYESIVAGAGDLSKAAVKYAAEPIGKSTEAKADDDVVIAEAIKPEHKKPQRKFHMIVEAETADKALEIAVSRLKKIHEKLGTESAAAKTTADKLNLRGLSDSIVEKMAGRDFVIENAGELSQEVADRLLKLIKEDDTGMIAVLVDTPDGFDRLEEKRPELFDICDYISDEDEKSEEAKPENSVPQLREPVKRSEKQVNPEYKNNLKVKTPEDEDEEMENDEFAQYCAQYAASIDCSIDKKSMLALYERIELMEEDGIPLTKANAEKLIEETADRAEKPPIGKRLKELFHSKYDKNGLLMLKENDFIY